MSKKELLDYYNKNAQLLAKKFGKMGPREDDIKNIFSYTSKRNPKVFEIGCGDGRDAEIILKYTNDYLGIDFSEAMIALAKKRLPNASFEVSQINKFPFPDGCDAIISFASIVHSNKNEAKEIFEKSYHALAENGIFYISTKYGKYSKKIFEDDLGTREFYYYSKGDLEPLIKPLKIIKSKKTWKNNQWWLEIVLQKV